MESNNGTGSKQTLIARLEFESAVWITAKEKDERADGLDPYWKRQRAETMEVLDRFLDKLHVIDLELIPVQPEPLASRGVE